MTTVDWTYTAPTDKACWTGLSSHTEKTCGDTGKKADGSVISATGTVGKMTTDGSTKYYVVSCEALKMKVFVTTAADDKAAKAAYDADTTKAADVEYTVVKGSAVSGCTEWPKG